MSNLNNNQLAKLEKIAKMVVYDVPQVDIAKACGVTEGNISQIIAMDEFKEIEAKIVREDFEQQQLISQGWDSIEALGVKQVVDVLNSPNCDNEFALKAAVVANKAVRRGKFTNSPIITDTGARATVFLKPTYINHLQQNFEIGGEKTRQLIEKQKDSDFMAPASVQKILEGNAEITVQQKLHQISDGTDETFNENLEESKLPGMENFVFNPLDA